MFFSIQSYHRMKEEMEAKKAEERKLERLRKEQEKARMATQRVQVHKLQVLNMNSTKSTISYYIIHIYVFLIVAMFHNT